MSGPWRREVARHREEWLGRALSARPADRPAAEAAISALYRSMGFPAPRFHWVSSPLAATCTLPPGNRGRRAEVIEELERWPVVAVLKAAAVEIRLAADTAERRAHSGVRDELRAFQQSLEACVWAVHRPALVQGSERALRLDGWYRTSAAPWTAYHDGLRSLAGVVFDPGHARILDLFKAVASAVNWWWPREHVCVVSERPLEIHTEADGRAGRRRLHRADGPAVRYADGWTTHAWHGTTVPEWVIADPAVERIAAERNVEVRRCAIERIGWADYLDRAGLALLATAPDPGNPGSELRLYDSGREDTRVLLAVNGSLERDGRRRRYGLTVPGHFLDPVAAAAWTYGLHRDQYARLSRRT